MKKIFSLIKATFSQDMNFLNYKSKKNSKNKLFLPIFLFFLVSISIGSYAELIAKPLHEVNMTYVLLTLFLFVVSILTFMQGIYKSQGILFESKDNDMLFSLPIKKSTILFLRIFKLILFQYIYNLMFLLPCYSIYIYHEGISLSFLLLSVLEILLVPLIPTILSSILGYIVMMVSSRFKSKKIIQTLISIFIFLGIYYLSFNLDSFVNDIASKATSINDILSKIYYPIGSYISLINKFDIVTFIKMLLINIIPFIIFIILGSKYYFSIIFKSSETSVKSGGKVSYKSRKKVFSLCNKELKKYFSSPVYMFNTSFGLILLLIASILLCVKGKDILSGIFSQYGISVNMSINLVFVVVILFSLFFTSITSSSISLEGKSINITKSLPVMISTIFNSKLLMAITIEMPFVIISLLIISTKFKLSFVYFILVLLFSLLIVLCNGMTGLIVNLRYPKLNYSSDTEVVKQSMSSMISVFIGLLFFVGITFCLFKLIDVISLNLLILIIIVGLAIICSGLYFFLNKFGVKDYERLSV